MAGDKNEGRHGWGIRGGSFAGPVSGLVHKEGGMGQSRSYLSRLKGLTKILLSGKFPP